MKRRHFIYLLFSGATCLLTLTACFRPFGGNEVLHSHTTPQTSTGNLQAVSNPHPTLDPYQPLPSPTPDQPHLLPTVRSASEQYVIQSGDTLGGVATMYGVDLDSILASNPGVDPYLLSIGQTINIPAPVPGVPGTSFKIVPDSELVYGPNSIDFDINDDVRSENGFLYSYSEEVDGVSLTGAQIIQRVAEEYSVNPRLLLSVLEYQSKWVTTHAVTSTLQAYPMGNFDQTLSGLYLQLSWAANELNRGFYLWQINATSHWVLIDGDFVPADATLNAGTAAVQYLMSKLHTRDGWDKAVGDGGVYQTFVEFFGNPFAYTYEPLLPPGLAQPTLLLPFETGAIWSFTGGPHAGWGDGSAWAALDFAPPGDALGCVQSDAWVTAVANGLVVRSGNGVVVLDLDGDGHEQTGWTILYLHIETRERVGVGTIVHVGDRIGHPSCEGGYSNGTHVHIARRYNGEWIAVDGSLPFVLDGWTSVGSGVEYDGQLVKNGQTVEAWDARKPENQISR
jgi:LasA protease